MMIWQSGTKWLKILSIICSERVEEAWEFQNVLDVIYGLLREGGWKGNHAMPETNKAPSSSLSPRYFFIQKMFGLSLSVPLCRSRGAHVLFKQNILLYS